MNQPSRRTWKEFEQLVERLQRAFNLKAIVTSNERIPGKYSRTLRELDITIRHDLGTSNLLIVVECKRFGRKVSLDKVDAFIEKLRDVGANHGIMVAENGFTGGALNRAADAGIETYTLLDTRKEGWSQQFKVQVFVEITTLKVHGWRLQNEDGTTFSPPSGGALRMFDSSSPADEITFDDFLRRLWKETGYPEGRFNLHCTGNPRGSLPAGGRVHITLDVETAFAGYIRPANLELLGLLDSKDGHTRTDAFKIVARSNGNSDQYTTRNGWKERSKGFGVTVSTDFVEMAEDSGTPRAMRMKKLQELLRSGFLELSADAGAKPFRVDFGNSL